MTGKKKVLKTNIENPKEKSLLDMAKGKKPMTKFEKELAKEIREIEEKGGMVEIPFDI